jgi:hypothetical protein
LLPEAVTGMRSEMTVQSEAVRTLKLAPVNVLVSLLDGVLTSFLIYRMSIISREPHGVIKANFKTHLNEILNSTVESSSFLTILNSP